MKYLRIIIPLFVFLGIIAAMVAFVIKSSTFQTTEVLCPDGTQLELIAVTYGQTHRCPMEHPWNRILQSIPEFIQRRLGVNTRNGYTSKEDSMVVWFRWKGRTTPWFGNKTVMDQDGYHSEINSSWSYNKTPPNPAIQNETWLGFAVPVYPKRDDSFTLQFSDWNQNVLAEFEIENPKKSTTEPFVAESLPAVRTMDNLQFTLLKVEVPNSNKTSSESKRVFHSEDVHAIFEIKEDGNVVENWQPVNIWLEDATGNQVKNTSWNNREENGTASMRFSSGLFPNEAWKIRAQFARKSEFLNKDLWTATIPLPNHPEYATNLVSHVIHDKKIVLRGIPDENGILLDGTKTNRNTGQRNPKVKNFNIFVEDMDTELRLDLVKVMDDQGRLCKQSGKSWGGGKYDYNLEIEEDAISLTVTVALHETWFADYIAMPQPFLPPSKK